MGKTGSWMQSIKKAIHNHIHGDLDRDKFQHLPHVSSESKECSTSSSHIIDESKEDDPNRRSSPTSQVEGNSYRGNSLKEEKARISNSRKEEKARTSTSRKDQKARISSSSNQANAAQTGSGQHKDGNGRLSTASQQQFGVSGSRDHHTYENAVYGDHESGSGHHHNTRFGSNSHQEEKRRSSTSLDRRNDGSEGIEKAQAPRHSTHSEKGGSQREEKGRSSTSSQGVPTEKKRSSNVYLTHNERTLLEKGRAITAPDQYNMQMLSGKGSRPGTPVSPDNRTKLLQIEKTDGSSTMHVMDKAASDKGRYRGPSSPRVQLIEKMHSDKSRAAVEKSSRQQTLSPQLGQCTALQDLLKPSTGSLEKRSSSSSSIYFSQVGGSARSCTSNGSQSSKEEFVELVFPLAQETRKVLPASPKVQRKKVISPSTKDVFSMPEYDVPLSPGGQRRRSSGTINTTVKEPVSTKSLLPPDYRKQQPARALADVGSVIFRSGDAGVGGMLGEWAAVAIQASWRGFAARQAYKALRGLVRLQALVRGYLVRRKITPLVKARIQAARVHQKLSRNNANVQLHQTSNGYGIALTVLESSRSQYGYAQPVLDDSQVRARGSSGAAPDALKCDVSGWNSSIILCTLAELKQEALMKKERASKRNEGRM